MTNSSLGYSVREKTITACTPGKKCIGQMPDLLFHYEDGTTDLGIPSKFIYVTYTDTASLYSAIKKYGNGYECWDEGRKLLIYPVKE
jgi:hypothetical protein